MHQPKWLSVEALESVLAAEKQAAQLQSLPFHYMEIAQTIMSNFREEFTEPDKILAILQDIENVRMDRIRTGIDTTARDIATGGKRVNAIMLRNASAMELVAIKFFLLGSLTSFDAFFATDASDGQRAGIVDPSAGTGSRKLRKYR